MIIKSLASPSIMNKRVMLGIELWPIMYFFVGVGMDWVGLDL